MATRHVAKNPRATQPHTQVRHWDNQRDTLDRPREKKIDADSAPTSDITHTPTPAASLGGTAEHQVL